MSTAAVWLVGGAPYQILRNVAVTGQANDLPFSGGAQAPSVCNGLLASAVVRPG